MTDARPTLSGRRRWLYLGLLGLFVLFFGFAGVMHFVRPEPFVRIVPPFFAQFGGAHFLVYLTGVFEIGGAVLLGLPKTRIFGSWALIAVLVIVFPANIYMAIEEVQIDPSAPLPTWALWARLPVQFVAMFGVWVVGKWTPRSVSEPTPQAEPPA